MSDFTPVNGRPDVSHFFEYAPADFINIAIQDNDTSFLLQFLKKRRRAPLPIPPDQRGRTVIHEAASRPEFKDCLELLLKYRDSVSINIDAELDDGKTALHIACENDCEQSVEILLKNGCDPYKLTSGYYTAFSVASERGNLEIIKCLLKYCENINQLDGGGLAPLHYATLHSNLEICHILLEKGANVRLRDKYHRLPVHLVCPKKSNVLHLLLKRDPTTINCRDEDGRTPLMYAANHTGANSYTKYVRMLLENGAKIDICDETGRTALHYAAFRGHDKILLLFLQSIDASRIEECLYSNIPSVLNSKHEIFSLTCCAIWSKNIECLEILLSSKLSKSILETPQVKSGENCCIIDSPLAFLFNHISPLTEAELLNSFLELLLKHKITKLDEFFKRFQIKWPLELLIFVHPFEIVFEMTNRPFREAELYLNQLQSNDIDIDYCLRCFYDNSQPFATFTDYRAYYLPVESAIYLKDVEMLKLFMSTSPILEPDIVSDEFNPILEIEEDSRSEMLQQLEKYREVMQYLISLKPVYFTQYELCGCDDQTDLPRFPYSTVGEEFSYSTLQQLCRTVIRRQVRERTLEENLRNFQRNILELPLPSSLKDYLLFKV